MIVEQLELRMVPQSSRIASSHPHDMRHAGHLCGKMTGDPVGFQIVRNDNVERALRMRARSERGELCNKRTVQRNMGLRLI